jgi:hypothetical protein
MSPLQQQEPQTEREAFENGFLYFSMALDTLASLPDVQCKRYGSYSVAWELRQDVSAVTFLLQLPLANTRLSTEQRFGISELVLALDSISSELLVSCETIEGNVLAMNHKSWVPLRAHAAALLAQLRPSIEECKRYIQNQRA